MVEKANPHESDSAITLENISGNKLGPSQVTIGEFFDSNST